MGCCMFCFVSAFFLLLLLLVFFFFFKLSLSFLFTPAHAGGEGAKRERKMRRLIYGKPGD